MRLIKSTFLNCALVILLATAIPADAVILYRTATRNTGTPSGTNAGSGWQWQGHWAGGFLGTPIAPNYFITASHLGGGVGQNIYWNGKNYLATAAYDDPSTDLKIYKVSTPFSSWAPIYTGTSETGKRAMVFGRGTTRGSEVKKGTTLKGWKWGTQDKVRSWGENTVDGTYSGGSGLGTLLKFDFDRAGLTNEGTLSTGDSGGAVFINDGGKWKLAGINYGVEVPFSLTGTNGSGFNAAIFDKGGLYVGGDGAWRSTSDTTSDIPATWYATRISSRQSWIKSIIGTVPAVGSIDSSGALSVGLVPEPSGGLVALTSASIALLGRRRGTGAAAPDVPGRD